MPKKKSPTTAPTRAKSTRDIAAAKRTRRSADDVLNLIVQAAAEEFKRCGFAGTTTAAIARKANVTEAQLFRYFGSKSNLFGETIFKPIDQHFLRFVSKHLLDERGSADAREMTPLYTTELQHFIRANSSMLISLVVAQTYDSGTIHGVGKINSLGAYFEHGATRMKKRMKKKSKVDPRLMVRVAFASVLGATMFRDWIFPEGLASEEEIEAAVNEFVMEGISANTGSD